MKIVIDSNIFIADYGFKSPNWQVLAEYVRRFEDVEICIPKVIIDEVSYRYNLSVSEINDKINDVIKCLKGVNINSDNYTNINEIPKYEALINENVTYRMLPYPQDMLEDIITRTIHRRKPAKQDRKDVRDTLIWLQIKELSVADNNNEVVFLTNNTSDFCKDKSGLLCDELLLECKNDKLNVKIHTSLRCFVTDHVYPLLNEYKDDSTASRKIQTLIEKYEFGELVCEDINNTDGLTDYLSENYGYPNAGISNAYNDKYTIELCNLIPLINGSIVANISVIGTCASRTMEILDYTHNEVIYGSIPIEISYNIDISLTLKDGAIIEDNIENIDYELL